ncbi:MAG: NAD(P)H-dependent oxidoreductase subunit E [candidate division Zixibacteria bacterium]|nr:NAD(P)H-dependent oxidoreductase subunit E [candidate division Zixibacteria bacterium]
MNPDEITAIVERHQDDRGALISILEEIQAKYSYLPEASLRTVAEKTGRSLIDVYGVATFYKAFSLKPRGKHLVSVCLGTACHVRGGPAIAQELEQQLGVRAGDTTSDNEFTLETVNCLGACALGPVVVVDGRYFSKVQVSGVSGILDKARTGLDKIDIATDDRIFPIDVSCARCNHSLMDAEHQIDGHPSISVTVSFGQKHGWIRISSLWGSYKVSSMHEIPTDTILHIFCPHCHAELIGGGSCSDCEAPMVPMIIRGGGVVQLCSRRGCKGHILDLGGTPVD